MPAPFLSYLRVYQPLPAFTGELAALVRTGLARGPVAAEQAGHREREACLRAQITGQLLPPKVSDVLVLGEGDAVRVCPLDTRVRAAAAVLEFLRSESPVLRRAALPAAERVVRRTAEQVLSEFSAGAAHVVSASWTVPLPWFALVDPAARQVTLDGPRRVWWRIPMAQARERSRRAEQVLRNSLGDTGPAQVLAETSRWLQLFDDDSVVELDYGGLVDLLDDTAVREDTSAADVHTALQALSEGDLGLARECYVRVREFWATVASKLATG